MHRYWSWLGILLILAGCRPQVGLPVTTGPTATMIIAETSTPVITEIPLTPTAPANCAFAWSERVLPEVSDQVNEAFEESGLGGVAAEASAYGEDCIDPQTNQVLQFTAMQTDFHLSIPIEETGNRQVMGEWVEQVMRVLEPFQPGNVPGPNPGYVGITFSAGGDRVSLWFPRNTARDLIKDGTHGSRLFDALQTP